MGVGVLSMWPECEKGGKEDMWRERAAGLNELLLSIRLLEKSSRPSPEDFLLFLDLLDILRLRVWMPSFFMVRGLLTCDRGEGSGEDGQQVRSDTNQQCVTCFVLIFFFSATPSRAPPTVGCCTITSVSPGSGYK